MAKADRNFVQRIYDAIVDFFDKMMSRYTDAEKVGSADMDAAVKQLQTEFENIKKMYKKALANTEAKRGVNMTLPRKGGVMHSDNNVTKDENGLQSNKTDSKIESNGLLNGDVRHSKNKVNDSENTEQFRVMWTLEENVLNRGEVSAFYDKVSEMKNQKWPNYKVSKDGEYIFEIENKLVYFDGDYDYPEITTVVSFDTSDGTLLQYGKERVYECEEFGYSVEDALQIAEITLGEGTTHKSYFGDSRAYEREITRGTGKDGTELNSQSGEDVKLSKSSVAEPSESIEPPMEQSASERSAASFELKEEVKAKLDKHIEKYGTLEKGVNPVRDVDLPKKTADDRYVRRGTRTVIESARVTDEVAQRLTEEIAKQIPSKWVDKLNAWRYFAMLGNPRTHIRNMVGNLAFMPAIFAKNLLSAVGEGTTAAALKIFGRQMQRTKTVKGVIKATLYVFEVTKKEIFIYKKHNKLILIILLCFFMYRNL